MLINLDILCVTIKAYSNVTEHRIQSENTWDFILYHLTATQHLHQWQKLMDTNNDVDNMQICPTSTYIFLIHEVVETLHLKIPNSHSSADGAQEWCCSRLSGRVGVGVECKYRLRGVWSSSSSLTSYLDSPVRAGPRPSWCHPNEGAFRAPPPQGHVPPCAPSSSTSHSWARLTAYSGPREIIGGGRGSAFLCRGRQCSSMIV